MHANDAEIAETRNDISQESNNIAREMICLTIDVEVYVG